MPHACLVLKIIQIVWQVTRLWHIFSCRDYFRLLDLCRYYSKLSKSGWNGRIWRFQRETRADASWRCWRSSCFNAAWGDRARRGGRFNTPGLQCILCSSAPHNKQHIVAWSSKKNFHVVKLFMIRESTVH